MCSGEDTTKVYVLLDGSGDFYTNSTTARIRANKRQCKILETEYPVDAEGFIIEPDTPPVEPNVGPEKCHGSGYCEVCVGTGVNRRIYGEPECEVCSGSGECPCLYDSEFHPEPSHGQWDWDEYREFRTENGLGWQG